MCKQAIDKFNVLNSASSWSDLGSARRTRLVRDPTPRKGHLRRDAAPTVARSSLDIGRRLALRSLAVQARDVVADAQSAEPVQ